MIYLLNFIRQILRDMWMHKLRSILALFGIVWGTLTVILLLALGHGFHEASKKNIMQIADGTLFAFPAVSSKPFQGFPQGQKINIKSDTIMQLPKSIPDIQAVSPMLKKTVNIGFRDQQTQNDVYGVSDNFGKLRKINLVPGSRFLNNVDTQNDTRVTVIGDKLKTRLFGDASALGQYISIKEVKFLVVGVVQPSEENVYNWYDNKAIIPYSTYIDLFGDENVHRFIVLPNPNIDGTKMEVMMRHYFAYKYHFNPDDDSALHVFDTTKMFQFFNYFFMGIQIFLGICGGLTLAVGALGVTNIMFLIVTERTREIGLRMAVGARDWHVMLQILLEAFAIIAIGGFIGFFVAFVTTEIMQYVPLPSWLGKPEISDASVIVTISILMIFGLLAGYFPAKRASKMDPIRALGLGH